MEGPGMMQQQQQHVHPRIHASMAHALQHASSISKGVMSPSINNAASIPVQWCTANHVHPSIHTYMCMVLTRLCLLPVGVDGRLHRRVESTKCRSKPFAAWRPAHGAFVTSFVVPLVEERSRTAAAAAAVFLPMSCVPAFDPTTPTLLLHTHTACRLACRLNTTPQSMPSRTSEISLPQR